MGSTNKDPIHHQTTQVHSHHEEESRRAIV